MQTYISDNSYISIKPETTAGVAVIPTIVLPLVSESMKTVVNHSLDRRIRSNDWEGNELLRAGRQHEGDISFLCDVETAGHIFNMLMNKGTTTGNATSGYVHPYTVGTGKTYTIEINKGAFAQRYFGVYVEEVTLDFDDQKLKVTLKTKALGAFGVASLGVALSGATTTITLDNQYDAENTRGLVAGDKVTVGGVDATITGVSGNVITITSVAITASVGDAVVLKPQSATAPTFTEPLNMGQLNVGFGATASDAETASASVSTSTPIYDLSITLRNSLFSENGSSRFDPVQIIAKTKGASLTLKRLLESGDQRNKFLSRTKQGISFLFTGKNINPDFSTNEVLKITFNNVKMDENPQVLDVGELITEEASFLCLYDDGDAQAMDVSVQNKSAGTVY